MLISTLNCEMWPNFSYRGVRSVQPLLLLSLLMVFSSENFGFSPPYAGIAGIGPGNKCLTTLKLLYVAAGRYFCSHTMVLQRFLSWGRILEKLYEPIVIYQENHVTITFAPNNRSFSYSAKEPGSSVIFIHFYA